MTKVILLCADDYAQTTSISEGIVQLAQKKRINAISCLVNSPGWQDMQPELTSLYQTTFIGLHLNFTFGKPLSQAWQKHYGSTFPALASLIKHCYLRRLHQESIQAEINAQLDAFIEATGTNPDFIDGHQHIHQLPLIRGTLLASYAQRKLTAFCRNTSNGGRDFLSLTSFPKRQMISMLGGLTFKKQLNQQGITTNTSFAGIYNFKNAHHYRHYFKQFLNISKTGGLIMCHPGIQAQEVSDPLYPYRHFEFDYFMSDSYLADLQEGQFTLRSKTINQQDRVNLW